MQVLKLLRRASTVLKLLLLSAGLLGLGPQLSLGLTGGIIIISKITVLHSAYYIMCYYNIIIKVDGDSNVCNISTKSLQSIIDMK